jgi:HSP20 family protein
MSPIKKVWLPAYMDYRTTPQQQDCNISVQFFNKGKWTPDTDIYEVDKGLLFIMDIAGLKKDDIQVILEGQVLTISGSRKEPALCKKYIHQLEIDFGQFERTFKIPQGIIADKIEVRYEDGFLSIWLPKQQDSEFTIICIV